MTTPSTELPSPAEAWLAYGIAFLASITWIACVIPGAHLADPTLPDDLATPMFRGAVLLVPALLLLVAAPISAILSRHALGLRGLLAWTSAFVALTATGAMFSTHPRGLGWVAVGHLGLLALVSLRDGVRLAQWASTEDPIDAPASHVDLRLVLSVLAFLAPASLLTLPPGEHASWYGPFAFLLVCALGDRASRTQVGLRAWSALSFALLGGHLAISMRWILCAGRPDVVGWTAAGTTAFAMTLGLLVLALTWALRLALGRVPVGASA